MALNFIVGRDYYIRTAGGLPCRCIYADDDFVVFKASYQNQPHTITVHWFNLVPDDYSEAPFDVTPVTKYKLYEDGNVRPKPPTKN